MWDHSSQVTTEGLNRPCLVAVVFTPSPPVGAGWCLGIFRRSADTPLSAHGFRGYPGHPNRSRKRHFYGLRAMRNCALSP
jgi:hypothetical protein